MRHGKKFNHLGRKADHRNAMLSNLATSLIMSKRIETTVAKAKALRKYVEPILTRAKVDNYDNRKEVFKHLNNKESIKELYNVVSDRIGDRPGGYTRIIKLGTRLGDSAQLCLIELVDFNETLMQAATEKAATKTRRSRRGSGAGKTSATVNADGSSAEVMADAPAAVTAPEVEAVVEAVPAVEAVAEEVVAEAPVVEAVAEAEPVAEVSAVEAAAEPVAEVVTAADDLTKIEGIGPKIAELLSNAGITTFALLAAAEDSAVQQVLIDAGPRFNQHDATTWNEQAALARDGKWAELRELQDRLNGGREVA